MALTYPLSIAAFADTLGIASVKWLLQDNRELSGMGSGQILQADLAPRLFTADVTTREFYHADAARLEAKLDAMIDAQGSFYLYDPRKLGPTLDPDGEILLGQNLFSWSEQFDNAYWIKANSSIVADAAVAPDGTMTMDKLVDSTSNPAHGCVRSFSYLLGERYTLSVYAKAGEYSKLRINAPFDSGLGLANFDLAAKTASVLNGAGAIARIEDVGAGALRCSLTITATNTNTQNVGFYLINNAGNISFAGDGASGLHIWGAQLEAGSIATEYRRREATPGAWSVQINSLPDAKSMSLKGLPPGYKLSAGDYLHFDYGDPARRAFHRLAEDVTANGSGVTAAFTVSPMIRPGAAVNLAVTLVKPAMKCIIRPGSVDIGSTGNIVTSQITFSVVQKL